MRLDKFMNAVNLVKRRSVAADMIKHSLVLVNDQIAKASKAVKIKDIITINYFAGAKQYEILQLPTLKSIPKSSRDEYVKALS